MVSRVAPVVSPRVVQVVSSVGLFEINALAACIGVHCVGRPACVNLIRVDVPDQQALLLKVSIRSVPLSVGQEEVLPAARDVYPNSGSALLDAGQPHKVWLCECGNAKPPQPVFGPGTHVGRGHLVVVVTAPHQPPDPDSLRIGPVLRIRVVEVGQSEGMTEFMADRACAHETPTVALHTTLDDVIVYLDHATTGRGIGGRKGRVLAPGFTLHRGIGVLVRPDARRTATTRLRRSRVDERRDIHVAVVVAGVGDAICAIIVKLAEVDQRISQHKRFLEEVRHVSVFVVVGGGLYEDAGRGSVTHGSTVPSTKNRFPDISAYNSVTVTAPLPLPKRRFWYCDGR